MDRKYWLLLSLAPLLAAASSVACSSEFSSCEARRACHHGGAKGAAEAGAAGESQVGNDVGGTGGRGGGSVPGTGSDEGGSAGAGEAEHGFPALFDACAVKGELTCAGHASAQRLACDGKFWQAGTTCAANERCDSANGKCAPVVTECASAQPGAAVCRQDTVLTCGADLVTAAVGETCQGVCASGVCHVPACGDEKVERGEDCDDADANASGACAKCKHGICGDGVVYVGHEQCDDGNKISGDGCSATCGAEPVELALGSEVTCARSSTGEVKCWGRNESGQLGLGDLVNRGDTPSTVPSQLPAIDLGTGRKAKAISVRGATVCALLVDGGVKCWGNNSSGQLGTGDRKNLGDAWGEMGDGLKPIAFGDGSKVTGVSAGSSHTCAVFESGSVKCWGSADSGQLGQDSKTDVLSPNLVPAVKLARPASAISASGYLYTARSGDWGANTCALLDDGAVQCWGAIDSVPHTDANDIDASRLIGDAVGEMSALPILKFSGGSPAKSIVAGPVSGALLADGSLRLWGTGSQLGQPLLGRSFVGLSPEQLNRLSAVDTGGKNVKSIAVGRYHACAIFLDGTLKCWGDSYEGALGLGDSTQPTDAAPGDIPPVDLSGHAAVQVAAGEKHTCAILDDGTVRCWGNNAQGQLGLGNTASTNRADTTLDLSF